MTIDSAEGEAAGGPARTPPRPWYPLMALCMAASAAPFLLVTFPPCTDLPQHVAQIPLLLQVLGSGPGPYAVSWLWPNNLVYALIGAAWFVLQPRDVGRFVMIALAASWIGGVFLVAHRRGRPAESAALASILAFSHPLYWGLLNFLIGWPAFLLWILETGGARGASARPSALTRLSVLSLLLYASHALWLAVGSVWLLVAALALRARPGVIIARLAALAPAAVLAALWYPQLASLRTLAGFEVGAHWSLFPLKRLLPGPIVDATFGGLRGPMEWIFTGAIALWIVAALASRRGELREGTDGLLALAAGVLLAISLLAPDAYMDTVLFRSRWFSCGLILLILALPAPRIDVRALKAAVAAVVALFFAWTSASWIAYERRELTGLAAALDAVTERSRVLGLDFVKTSAVVKYRPFLQLFAYAQVLKGCELNFSFTEHAVGIVRDRGLRRTAWTLGLEWSAEQVLNTDLLQFDEVLVNAEPGLHERLRDEPSLVPATHEGRWRLYRVTRPRSR